jgi:hypothetical protein
MLSPRRRKNPLFGLPLLLVGGVTIVPKGSRGRSIMVVEFVVETPEQASAHGERLTSVCKLANRIFDVSQAPVLDVETGTSLPCVPFYTVARHHDV